MEKQPKYEKRVVKCAEGDHIATLFIEWAEEAGKPVIHSITCDNPRLRDLDNWDCRWSCWEKIAGSGAIKKRKKK